MQKELNQSTVARIESILPDLNPLGQQVLALSPDLVSMALDPDSSVPVAVPCLEDAYHVACEARYALFEAYANLAWYGQESPLPDKMAAVWHAKFYATAAASCLYAAAEDVANAIVEMFAIDRQKLDAQDGKRGSLQSRVGAYLTKEMPTEALTSAICNLVESDSWRNTMDWRNRWVHEQSHVQGLGIVFSRNKRWRTFNSSLGSQTSVMQIGSGGDAPKYSVDEVLGFVNSAFTGFARILDEVVIRYLQILSQAGITNGPPQGE